MVPFPIFVLLVDCQLPLLRTGILSRDTHGRGCWGCVIHDVALHSSGSLSLTFPFSKMGFIYLIELFEDSVRYCPWTLWHRVVIQWMKVKSYFEISSTGEQFFFFPERREGKKWIFLLRRQQIQNYLWYLRRTSNHSKDEVAKVNQGDCELWDDALLFCYNTSIKIHNTSFFKNSMIWKKLRLLGGRVLQAGIEGVRRIVVYEWVAIQPSSG